jgi:hypothetical protein
MIIHLAIHTQDTRTFWAQGVQGTYGIGGLAFGADLQPFTQQHQRDHHG